MVPATDKGAYGTAGDGSGRLVVFARLAQDNKGVSVITYALILPLFLLLVFGIVQIWEVMSVRQSISLGAYQAVRRLSSDWVQSRGIYDPWKNITAAKWESDSARQARQIIAEQLKGNQLIPPDSMLRVLVVIEPEARANLRQLGWFFTVRAELVVPGLVTFPLLYTGSITFVEQQVGYIEGYTGWIPPPEFPTLVPTPPPTSIPDDAPY